MDLPPGSRATVLGGFVKPETFAIDWVRVRDARLFTGDGSEPGQWYGEERRCSRSRTASPSERAADDRRSARPHWNPEPADTGRVRRQPCGAAGPTWRLRFYAHIRPGTVRVRFGQHIHAGQQLGQLGNTGQTTVPHLPDGRLADRLPGRFYAARSRSRQSGSRSRSRPTRSASGGCVLNITASRSDPNGLTV